MSAGDFHQEIFDARLGDYCQKWADLLNLGNWAIDYRIADVVDGDGTIEGQCHVNTQLGHRATVTFASRIAFDEDQVREDLVVHEHLHIILDELGQFVYQHLPKEHHDYFTRLVEIAVSDLARVLVGVYENSEDLKGKRNGT